MLACEALAACMHRFRGRLYLWGADGSLSCGMKDYCGACTCHVHCLLHQNDNGEGQPTAEQLASMVPAHMRKSPCYLAS